MESQRILFINPPYSSPDTRIWTSSAKLGLLYMAAMLEREHQVKVLDLNLKCNLNEELHSFRPDIVGITAYSPQFPSAVELAGEIKEKFPDKTLVVGGHHATIDGANILRRYHCFDYAFRGEGEFSLPLLLNGNKESRIPGLVFRESGEVVDTAPAIIEDLNCLPFPARHLINHERYSDFPFRYLHHRHTSLITSRGCPHACIYCYSSPMKRYREHSPRYVLEEIKHVMSSGVSDFMITDDVFTLNRDRVVTICNLFLDEGLGITWSCGTRSDLVDGELLSVMKEAGCHVIYYGIESGNQEVLDKIGKGLSLETAKKAVRETKKVGIRVQGGFVLGFPFESREQMAETAEFSRQIGLDGAEYSIATPYPGTALWKLAGDDDPSDLKALATLDYNSVSGNPFSDRQELAAAYSQALVGFYFRRGVLFRTLHYMLTKGSLRRRWEFFKYLTFQGPADNSVGPDPDTLPTTPPLIERFFKEQCLLCHGCDHTCKKRWFCYCQKIVNRRIFSLYRGCLGLAEAYHARKNRGVCHAGPRENYAGVSATEPPHSP